MITFTVIADDNGVVTSSDQPDKTGPWWHHKTIGEALALIASWSDKWGVESFTINVSDKRVAYYEGAHMGA